MSNIHIYIFSKYEILLLSYSCKDADSPMKIVIPSFLLFLQKGLNLRGYPSKDHRQGAKTLFDKKRGECFFSDQFFPNLTGPSFRYRLYCTITRARYLMIVTWMIGGLCCVALSLSEHFFSFRWERAAFMFFYPTLEIGFVGIGTYICLLGPPYTLNTVIPLIQCGTFFSAVVENNLYFPMRYFG